MARSTITPAPAAFSAAFGCSTRERSWAGELVVREAGGAARDHQCHGAAAGALGDGAGPADVDAQLCDGRPGAAVRAAADGGGHLAAEGHEELAGERVAVEGVHGSASCRSESLG